MSTKCPYLYFATPTDIFPLTLNWGLRGFALRGFVFTMVAISSFSLPFPALTAFFLSPPYFSSVISHFEQISLTLIPTALTYPCVIQADSSGHLFKSLCYSYSLTPVQFVWGSRGGLVHAPGIPKCETAPGGLCKAYLHQIPPTYGRWPPSNLWTAPWWKTTRLSAISIKSKACSNLSRKS